jgi:outer membrane protein OmpA-like peptidoglycan-associated protein
MRTGVLILILVSSLTGISQNKAAFRFFDSSFVVGQKMILRVTYLLGKAELNAGSGPVIDSLYRFLEAHPALAVEIGTHASESNPASSSNLTHNRAKVVVNALITKGIARSRLSAISYGDRNPLVSEQAIRKAKTREEKAALRSKNRRTEVKLISVSFTP